MDKEDMDKDRDNMDIDKDIHGQRIETSVKVTALRYCCCSVPELGLTL